MNSTCASSGDIAGAGFAHAVAASPARRSMPSAFATQTSPFVAVAEQRRRRAVVGNLPAVVRQVVSRHREVAVGDPRLGLRRDASPSTGASACSSRRRHRRRLEPSLAPFRRRSSRSGAMKYSDDAVGRPGDVRHRAGMRRQLARFAAVGRQQIDLRELVVAALRDERDRLAVGRPARAVLVLGAAASAAPARRRPAGARQMCETRRPVFQSASLACRARRCRPATAAGRQAAGGSADRRCPSAAATALAPRRRQR